MEQSSIKVLKKELEDIKNLKIQIENVTNHLFDNQIPKGSKAFNLKCSVLFVDIRNSTEMTDKNGRKNMIKIYKMFAKLVIKAVEENKGRVDQIMGDGMLCTFIEEGSSSGAKAFEAAKEINQYLDEAYNPIVEESWKICCGIGIRTGDIYLTRIGTRGKNKTCKVAYPSSITNYACKLCSIAKGREVLMDDTTYNQIDKSDLKYEEIKNKPDKCKGIKEKLWRVIL